jgi:hypothetical protein
VGAVTLLTPWGLRLWVYPFTTINHSFTTHKIIEFMPIRGELSWLYPPFLFLLAGSLLLPFATRHHFLVYQWLVGCLLAIMALRSRVYVPFFAVLATPLATTQLALWNQQFRKWAALRYSRFHRMAAPAASERSIFATLSIGALLPITLGQTPLLAPGSFPIDQDRLPVSIVNWFHLTQSHGRIFNHFDWGGYLLFELSPKSSVFVDGRAETLYSPSQLSQCDQAQRGDPALAEAMAKQANYAVWPSQHPMIGTLRASPHWKLVFRDRVGCVFRTVSTQNDNHPSPLIRKNRAKINAFERR